MTYSPFLFEQSFLYSLFTKSERSRPRTPIYYNRAKNNEEQEKETEKEISATPKKDFDFADPFLADFNDLGKDVEKSNIDQAPLDIAGNVLFAKLDRILSGVNSTPTNLLAKVKFVGSSIHAESVNSATLLVETYELLEHKDLDSIASDEDLMKTFLTNPFSFMPPSHNSPTLQRSCHQTLEVFKRSRPRIAACLTSSGLPSCPHRVKIQALQGLKKYKEEKI